MCGVTTVLAGQIYRLSGSVGCTKLTDLKYIIQQKLRLKVNLSCVMDPIASP
jgi:hypothetical protein